VELADALSGDAQRWRIHDATLTILQDAGLSSSAINESGSTQVSILPETFDAVGVESPFIRDECKAVQHRLGNQHAIERILMMTNQASSTLGVANRH